MRITCLITVCAYLSSTVSSDEIQYLNRLKRTRLREESILDDTTARKELNPRIRPDLFSTLRKSRPQEKIETFQNPFQKKVHEIQSKSQQQHSRDRSRHPVKRLKVRSIVGSTHEIDDNEVHEFIHKSILEEHDKGSIYIKPVFRVTTKTSIFDSIMDILHQLLEPKKELGPIVGPIHKPGSKRKIYLRLLEPVDTSHINVRFVTQIPVPVVDAESQEHESVLSFLPFIDPSFTFLNRHPVGSSDATFSSSNRHPSIQLPRNASHVSDKDRESQPKPAIKLKRLPPEETDKKNVLPVKMEASSGTESDKNLYYQFQSEDDAVKEVTEIIENATENKQGSKDSLEPWYQLSTHHLPLRQIAPLYPLSMMEHTNSNSYEDTYKVPSDSLIVPSQHSSSYEQYSNVNAAPEFYDQSYTMPNTYTTTHQEQNEFSNTPSFHPISYQNEFNNAPSSTSHVKQNDLFSVPTTYTGSYEKPATVPLLSSSYVTSHEIQNGIQTGSSSQNALRVIDPPAYFFDPRQVSENANKVFKYPIQPYNSLNVNEIDSSSRNTVQNGELPIDQVTWGKVKREKSESNFQKSKSNFQKSAEITSDDNREKWQPLMFVSEDADWHKTFANLAKIANSNYHETVTKQSVNHSRQVSRNTTPSTIQTGRIDQRGQNGKRHKPSVATTRNSKCSISDKEDRCERIESTIVSTPYLEDTTKIMKEQTQLVANVESIVVTSKSMANNTVETLRSNITKSNWIEEPQPLVMTTESLATNSTTEPPLLIKMIKNTTEKLIKNKTTLSGSMMNNLTEKKIASSMMEKPSISNTSEASIPKSTTKRLQFPKRPMIMKKPIFLLKKTESSSTTKRTVANSTTRKPTMNSTTEKTRRSKYRSMVSKTKSNTT